jgi:1-phosphofructokinase
VITTVTLNPTIDEAVTIDTFVLGAANRCALDALDPGGKGVNASRVIHRLGRATVALGFVGGLTGEMLRRRLDAEGVPHAFDEVGGLTRLNVMIYERAGGRRSRLYLPGPTVTAHSLATLRVRLGEVPPGGIVVLGGSVPPGLGDDVYATLVARLRGRGVRAIVDTSGRALAAVLGAGPLLVKPNAEEAAELLGRPILTDEDAVEAGRELRARGAENVVVSQGEGGAVAVGPGGCWKAVPPRVVARSTVGSGDSMVAGLAVALAEGRALEDGLRLGTACGAATAAVAGTRLCEKDGVDALLPRVVPRELQPARGPSADRA